MANIPIFSQSDINRRLDPIINSGIAPPFEPLPAGRNPFSQAVTFPLGDVGFDMPITPLNQNSVNFKVRLVSILNMVQGAPGNIKQVIFEVTPTLNESRTVEYASVQPVHMPGGIQVYKHTGSRNFELSAHFISRNTEDAMMNMQYLQVLRSWTMPFFGKSSTDYTGSSNNNIARIPSTPFLNQQSADQQLSNSIGRINGKFDGGGTGGINLLGAPPEVLYLYGYSSSQNDQRGSAPGVNINRIPVVMTNLNISYSEEVDYIPVQLSPTANTEPFPVKMDVSMTLLETHSPVEYEQFSLTAFKNGTLKHF